MLFYKNFDLICRQRGTSASAAAKAIGRNKGSASNWKKHGTIPKEDELIALSKHLNCLVSDFFRQSGESQSGYSQMMDGHPIEESPEKLPPAEDETLDDYQSDFLIIYNSLSPRDRMKLMSMIYDFADEREIEL